MFCLVLASQVPQSLYDVVVVVVVVSVCVVTNLEKMAAFCAVTACGALFRHRRHKGPPMAVDIRCCYCWHLTNS